MARRMLQYVSAQDDKTKPAAAGASALDFIRSLPPGLIKATRDHTAVILRVPGAEDPPARLFAVASVVRTFKRRYSELRATGTFLLISHWHVGAMDIPGLVACPFVP
ncbi:unnamed protein product [Symbiodinium natans]|uniref:Uncharacterized protein n=1 Tax=Symbiodinium natans TaxID=878477 RepID=A0A812HUR4_9DINO|nr:unnamed protein product [Symbiodinium natans]